MSEISIRNRILQLFIFSSATAEGRKYRYRVKISCRENEFSSFIQVRVKFLLPPAL